MSFSFAIGAAHRLHASASAATLRLAALDSGGRHLGEITLDLASADVAAKVSTAINDADAEALGLRPMSAAPAIPLEAFWLDENRFVAIEPAGTGWLIAEWPEIGPQPPEDFGGWRPLPLRTALRVSARASPL